MASQETSDEAVDLSKLLDDALQGFGVPATSDIQQPARGTTSSATTSTGEPQPSTSKPPTKPAPQKGLAFDPLASSRRTAAAPAPKPSPPATAPPPPNFPSIPGGGGGSNEEEAMAAELSKLLAELAKVDPQSRLPQGLGAALGTSHSSNTNRAPGSQDLAATLQALADQHPQFSQGGGALGGDFDLEGNMTPEEEEAFVKRLTEQFQGLAGGALGGGGEGEGEMPGGMSSLVDTIMAQLLSKDVLYQPMKDIGDRYPSWLEANADKLPAEELTRYKEQYSYIQQICKLYEEDPSNFTELVNLLQEMQQRGQPPQEIVDELAPGVAFGAEGPLGMLEGLGGGGGAGPPGDCCIQ